MTDSLPSSVQIAICIVCGLFGSIISSSVFLIWQKRQNIQSNPHKQQQQPLHDKYNHDHPQHPKHINTSNMDNNNYLNHGINHNQCLNINNTQIILDWDDTLFPTAYTEMSLKNGISSSQNISKNDWCLLQEMRDIVINLVFMYIELFGAQNICIVTNAERKWFKQSCTMYNKLYAPFWNLIINKYPIAVISAHDLYKRQKSSAFMDVLRDKYNISKVICIGDSNQEYDGIHNVCNILRVIRKRSINYYRFKLLETPSLNALIKQLNDIKKLDYYTISKQQYDESYKFKSFERKYINTRNNDKLSNHMNCESFKNCNDEYVGSTVETLRGNQNGQRVYIKNDKINISPLYRST